MEINIPGAVSNLDYFEYKKKISDLKSQLKFLTDFIELINEDSDLFNNKKDEIHRLLIELKSIKETNPKKLEAIKVIFARVIQDNPNLLPKELTETYNYIKKCVLEVKKEHAVKIDLKDRGFFIITKSTLPNSRVVEVAMRTDFLGKGCCGIVYNLEYIHRQDDESKVGHKIMKIAKDEESHILDIFNEVQKLNLLDGSPGLQSKPTVSFEKGYIADKMDGDALKLLEMNISTKEKLRMTKNVVAGIETLKAKDIYHGDIRLDNMLFKEENGEFDLVISDFGGMREYKNVLKETLPESADLENENCMFKANIPVRTFLNRIQAQLDFAKKEMAKLPSGENENKRAEIVKNFNQKAKAILQQNDRFTLGNALYGLWVGDPHQCMMYNIVVFDKGHLEAVDKKLRANNVPDEAIDIIKSFMGEHLSDADAALESEQLPDDVLELLKLFMGN